MRKIDVGNIDILENGDLKLSISPKAGMMVTICFGFGAGSLMNFYSSTTHNFQEDIEVLDADFQTTLNISPKDQISIAEDEIIIPYSQENPINVSLEEINSMNIIINDSNCRDDFINKVCEELDRDGIKYSYTKNSQGINKDNAVVITLDQQYMAGPAAVIFAPLENDRTGNSDALALAAERAFYEKGFLIDGVACGQMGFRENDDGTISERIPTQTEENISQDLNASFITISFGTQNTHAGLAAAGIESTLTRYYSYIHDEFSNQDLIYCVEQGDNYDIIAQKFDTSSEVVENFNQTSDETILLTGETIINPVVKEIRAFNKHVPTNLYIDKTIWSK